MHLHADEALFGARRARSERAVLLRLALLVTALALNLALDRPLHVGLLAAVGAAAVVAGRAGRARLGLLALTAALVGAAWEVFGALGFDRAELARPALRWIGGTAWALWFGIGVTWPGFRRALARLRVPAAWIEVLDLAVVHGLLLARELERRRDAAAVRGGLARPWGRLVTYGAVAGGGVVRMFERETALEDARALRAAGAPAPSTAAAPGAPLAELDGVGVCAPDGRSRLLDVSLALPRGRWTVLAGPSGSGKTTLLRAVAGLEPPSHGRLARFGAPVGGARARERVDARVAMVFQDPEDQFFASTALEDLLWGLAQRGVVGDAARARATAVLDALGIGHLAERPVHRASFGERKRLALATALVTEPELLLVDEPTMGLDAPAARRVAEVLERAATACGATVVWATHDLGALPDGVEHAWLLRDGRLVFDGPRSEALSPANLERAGLAR